MPWTHSQQRRLQTEKGVLAKYFRNKVTWNNPTGNATVDLNTTTNSNSRYTLRIYLPSDFPNSCPQLAVIYPSVLYNNSGYRMGEISDSDHTYGFRDGYLTICHYRPNLWTSDNTLYQVFMKGIIWLEAYEGHKQTGKPLSNYLREM